VDVVYIALPNGLHAEWTIRALEAGKHVLCEKPLALSVEDVDAIAAAADRAGRIAVEATMALHHPQTNLAVRLAADGTLGEVQLVDAAFSFVLDYPNDPRIDPTLGGGSLWDVGCYCVNVSRRIAGEEPVGLDGFARFDAEGVDRSFVGILRFPSGMLAHFESGFAASRERVEVVGTEATLVLASPFLPSPDGPPASVVVVRDGERTDVPIDDVDQYRLEVDDLHAAMAGEKAPHVDLTFSRGSIASLVALDRAARRETGVGSLPSRPG